MNHLWWIIPLYYVGALTMARILVLWVKQDRQIRLDTCPACRDKEQWCSKCIKRNFDLKVRRNIGVPFWPIPAIYLLSKKVIFPHGVVTKYEKQKKLAADRAERERELKEHEARLREVCDDLHLPWPVISVGREGRPERERSNG